MKRCPFCNRTYTDPNLSFCVEDGTPLSTEEPAEPAPYRPPSAYVPPVTGKPRRVWPWVLGLVGAFGIGAVVLLIGAALFVPRLTKPVERTTTTDTTDQTEKVDLPPPTDENEVLSQLTQIENEWTKANIDADKQTLRRILADDYVGPSAEGGLMGKAEYLNTIERDSGIEKWEFHDLKLQLAGNRATLTGGIAYVIQGENVAYNFTDRFVWRNGRWQATGSEIHRKE